MSSQGQTLAEKAAHCDSYCPPGFFESRFAEILPVINELQDALTTLVEFIDECQDFESMHNPDPPDESVHHERQDSGPPFDDVPF